jgi:RNA polymerase sigma-70 factor, ECF subfamily
MTSRKYRSNRISTRPCAENGNDRDCGLIGAIAGGDRAALNEIHSRYSRRIEAFALKLTGRRDLAEEIACETLTVVWLSAARFRNASKVSTWIFGITHVLSSKALQNVRAAASIATDSQVEFSDPWSNTEVRGWLDAALALLPAEQRAALELCYLMGHSCQQIADSLGCPVSTVKTRMFHGRRKLRQLLPKLAGERGCGAKDKAERRPEPACRRDELDRATPAHASGPFRCPHHHV